MKRAAFITLLTAAVAFAHHSLHATYDFDQRVTIEGKVVKFLLRNPHTYLEVDAPGESGQMQTWEIEWGAAGQLVARGIHWDTLKPGDGVTITMSPGRQAENHRGVVRIIRRPSDGFEWGTKPGEVPMDWGSQLK